MYIGWGWSHERYGKLYSETGPMGADELRIDDYGTYWRINLEGEAEAKYVEPPRVIVAELPEALKAKIGDFEQRMKRRRESERTA
jgi:hypothetical protein